MAKFSIYMIEYWSIIYKFFFAYFERKELSYIMMRNWKNYVFIKTENIKLLKRYLSIVQNDQ